jgi:hypothetical protein
MHHGNRDHRRRPSSETQQRSVCLECAAGCRCGRHRVPGSRIDRLRAPPNALLDHERSAQTGAPAIFLAIFDRRWRTVAALDRVLVLARPNAIEDLAIAGFELSGAPWSQANSSVWSFQTLGTLERERLAGELQGFACVSICFSSATRDPRCTRDIVICFSRNWARPAGHAEKLISLRLVPHGRERGERSPMCASVPRETDQLISRLVSTRH